MLIFEWHHKKKKKSKVRHDLLKMCDKMSKDIRSDGQKFESGQREQTSMGHKVECEKMNYFLTVEKFLLICLFFKI